MIKLSEKLKTRSLFFTFTLFFLLFEKSIASVTDQDIHKFTEEILSIDDSGLSNLVTYDKQGKAETSQDSAKNPLLNVDRRAFKHPTVAALRALFDNYNPDVAYTEIIIKDEKLEESKFIDAVMETPVMQNTYNFLTQEGLFEGNQESFKQWWGELWFTKYSKGNGTTRSSAFKHVFLGEIKNNIVSGLHNWIFFNDQETRKTLKYMGWIRFLDFYKGSVLKVHFTWNNCYKPIDSLFVGTSPELELALYTVCYLARPGRTCIIKLNGEQLVIQSYTFHRRDSKKFIGSIYPLLD